jgi:acylphosphatase
MSSSHAAHKRLSATVHGRVQGVGFRQSTVSTAQRLGVAGWVANLRNGNVRVVAEGDELVLQRLLRWLHEGPSMAHVSYVDFEWSEATGEFDGFDVLW